MHGDNIEIGLTADRDVIAACRSGLPGVDPALTIIDAEGIHLKDPAEEGAFAQIDLAGPDLEDLDPTSEERSAYERIGATAYSYALEGTRYGVASELIEALSKVATIAVFNDWDRVLSAPEFLSLSPEDRVRFIGAKHDAYAAEKRATAAE